MALRARTLLVALVLCAVASSGFAQERRSRIGFALSGGGALGLAHIGVLKYMEEHRIPVDAVAGTSMGGLVGGLYATGLSAKDLEEIALKAPWSELLRATPKYENRPIAEKQSWNRTDEVLTLRFKRDLSLPAGLNPGQPLALLLSRYTAAYADLETFDELPIPFRCMATDLTNSRAFMLDHGSLPLAMRATMAVPGIFTPVKWGNRVLVDGGAIDNIPVDAARGMRSDVVIAVSLETSNVRPENLNTMTAVLKQLVSVMVLDNERRSLAKADLVIPVKLEELTSLDFMRADRIIAAGYEAAQQMRSQLQPYELSESDWQQYTQAHDARIRRAPDAGKIVEVNSPQPGIRENAQQELARKLPGTVDRARIERTLTGITAATSLPSAYYGWRQGEDGNSGFTVTLEERPAKGELLLRPMLSVQASGGEPARVSLHVSSVANFRNEYKSRILGEYSIGSDPGMRLEFYKPVDGHPYFVAPGVLVQRTHLDSYSGSQRSEFVRDRFAGTFYAGLGTWRFVQWRTGFTTGYDRYSKPLTTDGVSATSTGFLNAETNLLIDTQDSGALPTRGTRLDATLGYSVRNHSYPYLKTTFSKFVPIRSGMSLFTVGHEASSLGRKLSYYDQFAGEGLAGLQAYRLQEFHANTLAVAGGGLEISLPAPRALSWKPRIAAWHNVGRLDLGSQGWQTHQSTSVGLFGSSPLGPAGLVLSISEEGDARFRFVFGRF